MRNFQSLNGIIDIHKILSLFIFILITKTFFLKQKMKIIFCLTYIYINFNYYQ